MLALILVEAGLRPQLPHRRGRQRDRHQRRVGHGASGWWSRPTRATAPSSRLDPEIAVVTNVEPDHLDYYGGFDRPWWTPSTASARGGPVPWWWGPTTPWPPSSAGPTAPTWWGRPPMPPTGSRSLRARRDGVSFDLRHRRARRSGRSGAAGARAPTTPATRPWPRWPPSPSGPPSTPPPGRWPASPGWPAGSSSAARWTGCASSTTTPTCPPRWPPCSRRRARPAPGRIVVVFQPHRYSRIGALGEQFADAFVDADVVVVTDVYAAGEAAACPGVTGRIVADAVVAGPSRPRRQLHRRSRRTCAGTVAGLLAPGRPVPDPRRRRPHVAPRRAAWRRRRGERRPPSRLETAGRRALGPPGRAPRPARGAHHLPGGGTAARPRRGGRRGRPRRRAPRPGRDGLRRCRVLVLGKGSNLLVADAGFAGLVVVASGPGSAAIEIDGHDGAGRWRRASFPSWPGARAAAGLHGLEWAVGVPGSVGGARPDERRRPRLGHRRRARAPRAWSTWHRSAVRRRPRAPRASATGTRRSDRGDVGGVGRVRRSRPGTAGDGRGDGGRDRALAPGPPARGVQRRVGVHQPRRATPPAGWWRRRA